MDLELVLEFKPQRYYRLGLAGSALTVALGLGVLAWSGAAATLRRRTHHG